MASCALAVCKHTSKQAKPGIARKLFCFAWDRGFTITRGTNRSRGLHETKTRAEPQLSLRMSRPAYYVEEASLKGESCLEKLVKLACDILALRELA